MTKEEKERVNKLIKEISHGNGDVFDELYNIMYNVLYCFLLVFEDDRDKINDIIIDTFKIVIDKCSKKLFFVNCTSWIIEIAKMVRLNYNKKRQDYIVVDTLPDNQSFIEPVDEQYIDLQRLINQLPTRDEKILYLKYYYHYKNKEIQKIMKLSKSTIERSINDSLKFLKEKLNDEE